MDPLVMHSLQNTDIHEEGVIAIAEALKTNTVLKTLK
jgi:hypothetical protein